MSITVIKPGLLTTIQDEGRYGYEKLGVIVSGAMDLYAMRLANILVGNHENEGVLEITLIGPELKLEEGSLIAITGGDISPQINEKDVPMGRPVYLKEDCILKFGRCIKGCRAYLSIAGGFNVPMIMESKSTYLRGGFGGKDGRSLKKNDVIETNKKGELSLKIIEKVKEEGEALEEFIYTKWYVKNLIVQNSEYTTIRVFEDRQFSRASEESIDEFFKKPFVIDGKSDRMGYRLKGPQIKFKEKIEMISGEVSFGTIQIPPDGNPIILLADRATAGGYPKIAHVIAYDIPKLVQLKPPDKIIFKKVTIEEAERLYLKREYEIGEVKRAISLRIL